MTSKKPPCPAWLSKYGKAVWRRLSPSLFDQGILRYEDVFAFAGYCEAVALFRRATEELHEAGMTQESEKGWAAMHPAVSNFNNALDKMIKAGSLFGLDPSARSRLRIEAIEHEMSLADTLFEAVNGA